jgi:HEAT repeat protein
MVRRRSIEVLLLLVALGACKPGENDRSGGLKGSDRNGSARAAGALGDSQDYTGALKSPDPNARARAARALGNSRDHDGAVRALEVVLRHDPDRDVRVFAASALGKLGGPDATALLVEKTTSTDESYVRGAALLAIQTSRDPSGILGLINVFRLKRGHDDVIAESEASQALVKIGAPGVPQLLQALNDPSANVRRAVVDVLGELGKADVIDRISGLQADPDPAVRQAVVDTLAKLNATKR